MSEFPIELLIVEDDPQDAELIVEAVERQQLDGHRYIARDGVDALDVLFASPASAPPHLVLLDLKLPKIDGFGVLRRIRSNDQTRYTPVVVLTSSDMENDIETAYALGANSYVNKPMRYESFLEIVGEIVTYWLRLNRASLSSDA